MVDTKGFLKGIIDRHEDEIRTYVTTTEAMDQFIKYDGEMRAICIEANHGYVN